MKKYCIGLLFLAACGTHPSASTAPQPMASTAPSVRKDIHWFRSSAEYRGITREVYRDAGEHLAGLTRGMTAGSWAVILDADETVLDNSLHERRLADAGKTFNEGEWAGWVRERAATAIPGAVEFTKLVHEMGGRIAIVTNRADSLCGPTRENLAKVGVTADIVLCQSGPSDKNPRFQQVITGTAAPGIGALHVVEWLGDNIQDFPDLTQAIRTVPDGYANFGVRYFLLPNPMYGSWEKNVE